MSLIEVMVALVIMAMVAAATGFAVMQVWRNAQKQQAKIDAATIRQATLAYQMQVGECPEGVEALLREQVLSAQTNTADPWGNAFVIDCEGAEPSVRSAGLDGEHGTEDDLP